MQIMPRGTHIEPEQLTPAQEFEQAKTLHEVLAMAIVDFEAALLDPSYTIDFSGWHKPIGKDSIAVCVAGAVMAKRLGAGDRHALPEDFPDAQDRLEATYWLSVGRIAKAAAMLDVGSRLMTIAEMEGDPLETLSPRAKAATPLAADWEPILRFANCAKLDRLDSRRLRGLLRVMLVDLEEAGL
jgi:hypothetical protein